MEVNRRLGAELESALRPRARRLLDAVGVDPDSGHREEGFAALGLSVDESGGARGALSPGRHLRVVSDAWSIVSCRDERRVDLGWSFPCCVRC